MKKIRFYIVTNYLIEKIFVLEEEESMKVKRKNSNLEVLTYKELKINKTSKNFINVEKELK